MEMDYNYFASSAHQPYQYMGFGTDSGLPLGVSNDGSIPTPVSETKRNNMMGGSLTRRSRV
jgi:hypothetical protein